MVMVMSLSTFDVAAISIPSLYIEKCKRDAQRPAHHLIQGLVVVWRRQLEKKGTPIACTAEVVSAEEADLPNALEIQQKA